MNDEHQRIGVTEPGWFQRLQALEDAIAYRRARIAAPCPDCRTVPPGQRCDDHVRDLDLIDEYLQTHHRTAAALRAQTEHQRRRQPISPGPRPHDSVLPRQQPASTNRLQLKADRDLS